MNIEDFTAEDARKLSNKVNSNMEELLKDIKESAAAGHNRLYLYEEINSIDLEELRKRNFKIERQPSISIQKDSLYYIISW